MVDSCLRRSSPLEPPRISEPIQSSTRHPSDGATTLEALGQTPIYRTESSTMHVEQTDTAHGNQPSERLSPQSSPHENKLVRGSVDEGSNHESHTGNGQASMPLQVPNQAPLVTRLSIALKTAEWMRQPPIPLQEL